MITAAARNNAEWCDALCRTHGIAGQFGMDFWSSSRRTPPYYPDAVTLSATATPDEILAAVDSGAGSSVKDSFARLDLTEHGFRVLFDAEWITLPITQGDPQWTLVRDAVELAEWESAWGGDGSLFRPELLADKRIAILGERRGDHIVAGCIANESGPVVGLSNLFGDDAWAGAVATIGHYFPDKPIVGYEHGESLEAALQQGFQSIGPLRIWAR